MQLSTPYFEELFRSSFKDLCGIANRIVKDKDVAQDVVQDVFLKLWKREKELPAIENIQSYLLRATTNESINYLEKNRKTISLDKIPFNPSAGQSATITTTELETRIRYALNRLPPKCKAIFVLSRFEEMKYKEIAEHLDISVKTVENQMGIALWKMREDLKPYLTKEFLAQTISIGIIALLHFLSFYVAFLLAGQIL